MPQARAARLTFNRGLLSPLAGARLDLERLALSADEFLNFMPRVLGSMSLRPGLGYIGTSEQNAVSKSLRFVRSASNVARLEVTENGLRVWFEDALVTREDVDTAVTNGGFDSDVTGWTDADEAGATSAWLAGGYLSLTGNGTSAAIRRQQVTVAAADQGVEHALRIEIQRGPVQLRIGSTSGGDEYVTETTLGTGTHSLAFTPTGDFYIQFSNTRLTASLVDSVEVEAAGTMILPVPWGEDDLASIRYEQSADVLYVGSRVDGVGVQQRKIERRGNTSWSIVLYEPEDGPFRLVNTTPITIAASDINGDVTLTASKALFRSGHVGALFRLTSSGQLESATLTGADQFTAPIRVIGVGGQRDISIIVTGTWVATLTLQYSVAEPGSWVDVADFTTNQAISYNDELDNQIIYYRIGIKGGNYTSGTATATLVHTSGSTVGIVRITAYSSATSVSAAVIDTLGSTVATSNWNEGSWSTYRGFPTVPRLFEGRVIWWGAEKAYGSESDLYEDFDDTAEGDAGTIQRSIGSGPIADVHWAAALNRMIVGVATMSADVDCGIIDGNAPLEVRSTSFDDPLTPTNFNVKRPAATAVYVDQSGTRVFETVFNVDRQTYEPVDLTLLVPELNAAGITVLGVQHRPDVRIHCRRRDGTIGVLVFDRAENVICWCEVETDGEVEDVCILPSQGSTEDQVYYTVKRTINGSTVRYHEKWALESECTGRPEAHIADAFVIFESASQTTTITGADHLEGETVVVWGWNTVAPFEDVIGEVGHDMGTFVVTGGNITGLPESITRACYGLAYSARWRSTRNAFGDAIGISLNQPGKINSVGLVLKDTHALGLRYGQDFDHMNALPKRDLPKVAGVANEDYVYDEHEGRHIPLNGEWRTDTRLCLAAAAPRPANVLAAVIDLSKN